MVATLGRLVTHRWISRPHQLAASWMLGLVVGAATQLVLVWPVAAVIGWDAAALFFLATTWSTIWRLDASQVREVAARRDPGRGSTDLLLLLASITCIAGVGFVLIRAASAKGVAVAGLLAVAVASLLLSWLVVHSVFALRYACLFYRGSGGVDFHQESSPDYGDFAYMAFTIGMTFQVSDTDICDREVRRTALRHALLSFLFGAVLLAMTVNVGASLLK